ncbi:hypothetical protein F5X68DRAFT_186109 [Plectosphaerella plurivora]|uniref:Uncharacterized protein n=1 Tax=Plectosphaerella plurivora TaxID=936078 RepID=A0A9P9AFI6_9PEZI|nr:hypothetical protein F5X68DRAFT_186109 [Plectosphaerella plurivora]
MKNTLRGMSNNKANMEVITGAVIKRRGAEWTMLVWKGVGMFAPKRVAFWIREFFISAVLGSDLEVAWTMSSVRKFFRMEKLLTMYCITDEHYRHGTFIPARKQEAVLNRVDQNLRCGQPNAVSVHRILVRMGTVLELTGRDMRWKFAFTRSADELLQRDLELYDDDDALEAIIGPRATWGYS